MTVGSIERLRATKPADTFTPSVAQVRQIVESLALCQSLTDTATVAAVPTNDANAESALTKSRLLQPGAQGETQVGEWLVLNVVADLGTWLTHVGGGNDVITADAVDQAQGVLFQTPDAGGIPELVKRGKKLVEFSGLSALEQAKAAKLAETVIALVEAKANIESEEAAQAVVDTHLSARRELEQARRGKGSKAKARFAQAKAKATRVLIPEGFERKAWHKRDVVKALAAIVVANPDDEVIARFISRKYQAKAKVLTFPLVTQIWFFARMGRLEELDAISPKNPVFGELAVQAYDLLDVARRDAVAAIDVLCQRDVSDLDALADACVKARWVAERELTKVASLVATTKVRPTAERLLVQELAFLAQRVAQQPHNYKLQGIADLNAGHVLRIAANAGLDVENDDRSDETEIRNALKNLGFSSDLDQLVPTGVKAARMGRKDEFFEVMTARKDGNTQWHLLLADLLETAG